MWLWWKASSIDSTCVLVANWLQNSYSVVVVDDDEDDDENYHNES